MDKNFDNFIMKISGGQMPTFREMASAVKNHEATFLEFVVHNNPSGAWKALHDIDTNFEIGKNAGFTPDMKRIMGELQILMNEKDYDKINDFVSRVPFIENVQNYTGNPELVQNLRNIDVIGDDNMYKIIFTPDQKSTGTKKNENDILQGTSYANKTNADY